MKENEFNERLPLYLVVSHLSCFSSSLKARTIGKKSVVFSSTLLIGDRLPPEYVAEIEQLLTLIIVPSRHDLKAAFMTIVFAISLNCSGATRAVDSIFSTTRFSFAALSQRLIATDLFAWPSRSIVRVIAHGELELPIPSSFPKYSL